MLVSFTRINFGFSAEKICDESKFHYNYKDFLYAFSNNVQWHLELKPCTNLEEL